MEEFSYRDNVYEYVSCEFYVVLFDTTVGFDDSVRYFIRYDHINLVKSTARKNQ